MRAHLGLTLVLLAAACTLPPAATPDAGGPACAPPRHPDGQGGCVDCRSDADCPAGQRCSPLRATCEPPAADAGPPDAGPTDAGPACAAGASACDPAGSPAYRRCRDDGSGFEALGCDAGLTCAQVAGQAACRLCAPGARTCAAGPDGGGVLSCDPSGLGQTLAPCGPGETCQDGAGGPACACAPGALRCLGDGGPEREACAGPGWARSDCAANEVCGPGGACLSPCEALALDAGSAGCDFWAALLPNTAVDPAFTGGSANQALGTAPSEFGLVVTNPSSARTAHVTVEAQATAPAVPAVSAAVAPGGSAELRLPWRGVCGSGLARLGYHLVSDVPVSAHQFNPLSATLAGASCAGGAGCGPGQQCLGGACVAFSGSGDASLLLPTARLGTAYVVVAREHLTEDGRDLPAFMTVLATADDTHVRVKFAGAVGSTQQSAAGCGTLQGNVPGKSAGDLVDYTLSAGQVLQLSSAAAGTPTCTSNARPATICLYPNDLTGSVITSLPGAGGGPAKPIAVFAGADCTYVPSDQVACDHLEEEMLPLSGWGRLHVGGGRAGYASATRAAPDYYRLVSACGPGDCPGGVDVSITPPIAGYRAGAGTHAGGAPACASAGASTTCHLPPLNAGETAPWLELTHGSAFLAAATGPVALVQDLPGASTSGATEGDPASAVLPPAERWADSYRLPTPPGYAHPSAALAIDGLSAAACQTCGQVELDGAPVPASAWANLPGTTYWSAAVPLCGAAGCAPAHLLRSTGGARFGAVAYGYDAYTAYAYPAGLAP